MIQTYLKTIPGCHSYPVSWHGVNSGRNPGFLNIWIPAFAGMTPGVRKYFCFVSVTPTRMRHIPGSVQTALSFLIWRRKR